MKTYRWLTLVAAVLITGIASLIFVAASGTVHANPPAACDVQLSAVLTPDVPDPGDPGFLSSLLNNHPGYRLTLMGQGRGSVVDLDLSGPGPEDRCVNVIETMRKDSRVQSVRLQREPL
jgi:hypothetical protein